MGAPDGEADSGDNERPQHEVILQTFYLGGYPVTQAQWRIVANLPRINRDLEANPSQYEGDHLPVERFSRYDATEFCHRLSVQTGKTYQLPSEVEWEYACRSGTNTPFNFGETITSEIANYDGNRS